MLVFLSGSPTAGHPRHAGSALLHQPLHVLRVVHDSPQAGTAEFGRGARVQSPDDRRSQGVDLGVHDERPDCGLRAQEAAGSRVSGPGDFDQVPEAGVMESQAVFARSG